MKNQNRNIEEPTLLSMLISFFLFIILANEAGLVISILVTGFLFGLFVIKQIISKMLVGEEKVTSKNLRRLS